LNNSKDAYYYVYLTVLEGKEKAAGKYRIMGWSNKEKQQKDPEL